MGTEAIFMDEGVVGRFFRYGLAYGAAAGLLISGGIGLLAMTADVAPDPGVVGMTAMFGMAVGAITGVISSAIAAAVYTLGARSPESRRRTATVVSTAIGSALCSVAASLVLAQWLREPMILAVVMALAAGLTWLALRRILGPCRQISSTLSA